MVSALYIHIPFCRSRCRYCAFSTFAGLEFLHHRYLQALMLELEHLAAGSSFARPLQTVFLGGGTPTILSADRLNALLAHVGDLFGLGSDPEISLEANPGTVDEAKLVALREGGYNRISFGVQSFAPQELAVLGRSHGPQEAIRAVLSARSAGFTNISLDLMYGIPGQTTASWCSSLEQALRLAPDHLSIYQLTLEEGTELAARVANGELELPDEEAVVAMDRLNLESCLAEGLEMYEISNFARPGRRCRHNVNYWRNDPYLAAGAGAVSYLEGWRERRLADPGEYCCRLEQGLPVLVEREKLDPEASFRETVIMGLRMTDGVSRARLVSRFGLDPGKYYGKVLERLIARGLVELTPSHLRVTPEGRLYSNLILAELV